MRFSPCRASTRSQSAFTLVEVVVGLSLMASVLVGSLISFTAHHRQLRAAESKLTAVSIADELLSRLSGSRQGVPRAGRGAIAGRPGWYWQTRIVGVAAPAGIPLQVIRLEVIESRTDGTARLLTHVDIVESSS